ncbi:SRPBCC family protein [Kiloniella antarctica]|uniref:Carbon monoxide dehydrogenase subunit G n=1 Tax=Kiloniella antarctica TaxID=1550907 RepID=A0ABW5BG79_9PROT
MQMEGQQLIPAPQIKVWEALNDPEILRQSIPGCETVEKSSDTEFRASLTAKFGPVKAKFKGHVTLSDLDPPNGYTLTGEGKGGAAGFGKGEAKVSLKEQAGQTLLSYSVNAKVGGKLAQIGSRLVDAAAKKMADDFFKAFSKNVTSSDQNTPLQEPPLDMTDAADLNTVIPREPSKNWLLYIGGASLLIILAVYAFN